MFERGDKVKLTKDYHPVMGATIARGTKGTITECLRRAEGYMINFPNYSHCLVHETFLEPAD